MSTKQDQENYWREHLGLAEKHPVSQMAYCREAGLEARKLYAARERFKARAARGQAKALLVRPSQKPFVAVKVNEPKINSLPNPKWVAEFILHLQGGGQ